MVNKVDTGGGSITGSVVGEGSIWATNISSVNSVVDNSKTMPADIKVALRDAIDYIGKATIPEDEKEDASTCLKRVADELNKPKADEGVVKRSLDRLTKIVSGAGAIATLATAVAKLFGWV